MSYTKKQREVMANRKKAIAFLCEPARKRIPGILDKGNGERCCLGHMAYALDIPRIKNTNISGGNPAVFYYGAEHEGYSAPDELIEMLGMHDETGCSINEPYLMDNKGERFADSLAEANDEDKMSPQEIGAYLKSVIKGGDGTPFIHIKDIK